MWLLGPYPALLLLSVLPSVFALKTNDWKTCSQSAFCRRGRALAERASTSPDWKSPYSIDPSSVDISPNGASFNAAVKSSIYPDIKFKLELQVHKDGVVRARMDEADGLRKRYNEAASWALISEPEVSESIRWSAGKTDIRAVYDGITLTVKYETLRISLARNGQEEIVLNGGGLLHMEHFRTKAQEVETEEGIDDDASDQKVLEVDPKSWFEGEEDGWWEETFHSWRDSKPKGMHYFQPSVFYR